MTPAMEHAVRRLQQHGGSLPTGAIPASTLQALLEAGLVQVELGRVKLTS